MNVVDLLLKAGADIHQTAKVYTCTSILHATTCGAVLFMYVCEFRAILCWCVCQ